VTAQQVRLEPDHLIVWGDVDKVTADIAEVLRLEPSDGGVHPGAGTRNALFPMEGDRFLEVLGPDPAQVARSWGPDDRHPAGALWWWACRTTDPLFEVSARLLALGVSTGPVEPGVRIRPSGERLEWETLDPAPVPFGVALPFVIRWEDGPPLRGQGPGCVLRELQLLHPDPVALRAVLEGLGLGSAVEVGRGPTPGLRATIGGPRGDVLWLGTR
jgi:hypothetical protein